MISVCSLFVEITFLDLLVSEEIGFHADQCCCYVRAEQSNGRRLQRRKSFRVRIVLFSRAEK